MPLAKRDIFLSAFVGLVVAGLAMIVIKNLEIILPINKNWLLILFPILSSVGLYASYLVSKIWRPFVFQFGKFFIIGGLNTFLDLGTLNFLIMVTSITQGWWFTTFKGVSFVVAVINSFFWNKYWTFQKSGSFFLFFLVVFGSFLINVGIASFLVNIVGPINGFSPKAWDNVAALSSVVLVLTWNFLGMRYIDFRKNLTT